MLGDIFIHGLMFGGMYAVLASGFALIFGVARILNMAHTAFYMIAAFFIYSATTMLGLSPLLAFGLAIIIAAIIAMVVYRLLIDRVKHHELTVMIICVAIAVLFQEVLLLAFGGHFVGIEPFARGFLEIAGVRVSYQYCLAIVSSALALGCIWALLAKTRLGKAIRAISQDREIASLMGINVGRVMLITMGISGAFAGLAGAVVAPIVTVHPLMWMSPLIMILAAVVLGGLGSVKGAIVGAFVLGFIEAAVIFLVPQGSFLREAVALATMVVVLLVRSEGLFGIRFEEERL